MRIATVTEGPTDRLVLKAIIDKLIPGPHIYLDLQPSDPLGPSGSGWKGVRQWCRDRLKPDQDSLDELMSLFDLLVIHLDGEVAGEHDLQEGIEPPLAVPNPLCPPASIGAGFLQDVCVAWLNRRDELPPKIVFAIPSEGMETWVFAALHPGDPLVAEPTFECQHVGFKRPDMKLTLKKYDKVLARDADGKVKKNRREYAMLAKAVAEKWSAVCLLCAQAEAFSEEAMAHAGP